MNYYPILVLFLFIAESAFSQRLPFENYSVDKGLSQSQVFGITQDDEKQLWVGTFGGLNRFDGSIFKVYGRKDGLSTSTITSVYKAKNGYIWLGTTKGISCYDGTKFINYIVAGSYLNYNFSTISEGAGGVIYAIDRSKGLFYLNTGTFIKEKIPLVKNLPTCLFLDKTQKLWIYIYEDGLYTQQNNKWLKTIDFSKILKKETIIFISESNDNFYAITNKGKIFQYSNDTILQTKNIRSDRIYSFLIGDDNDIWIGSANGLHIYNSNNLSLKRIINASNGLSDNYIISVFKDIDGNIWFGSDGDGVFRYSYGAFHKYDKANGLRGNIVMGFTTTKNDELLLGTREDGLFLFNEKLNGFIKVDYSKYSNAGVNCLGSDSLKNIYIGTMDNKLLKMSGNQISQINLTADRNPGIFSIIPFKDGILANTMGGTFFVNTHTIEKIPGLNETIVSSLPLKNGNIIFGGMNGVYVYSKKKFQRIILQQLRGISVSTLSQYEDYIIIGSNDGLFFWNPVNNRIITCDVSNGLSDNNVFSVLCDSMKNIWVGTSSGVHRVSFNPKKPSLQVKDFSLSDGYESSETNLNAMIEDIKGRLWIGTTKGAFVYHYPRGKKKIASPYIIINNANFSKFTFEEKFPWSHLPVRPEIFYENNSVSFNVKAVYLSNPAEISYSYKLSGYDTGFSAPSEAPFISYKNLEPGNYDLHVKAYTKNGIESANTAVYPFTVIMPFYKSIWFKVMVILGLITMGIIANYIFLRIKINEQKKLRILKEKEQERLREQTAEDFHDELGNKLTRITVLTEILQSKTHPAEVEQNKIIEQIKANALALYTGTKEIVWSLSKESGNLIEILNALKKTGMELFKDTGTNFRIYGIRNIPVDIMLPPGYNRNIMMIFKELFTNSLRHSECDEVIIEVQRIAGRNIIFRYTDNGKGFNKSNIKRGNGISNIERRVKRIDGILSISSIEKQGTTCTFQINF